MNQMLRVDMSCLAVTTEKLPESYRLLGGRALTSRIVSDEVQPLCNPLGPQNLLVLAPGLLAGTTASSANRLSVGCKSPLTGGIKEANAGGMVGMVLAQLGYRAVVISGQPEPGRPYVLVVDAEGGRLESAEPLRGLGTYATVRQLQEQYGRRVAVSVIGPPGEARLNLAGICHTDAEGRPSRVSARGGVGAVMGSKGLKAIVYAGARAAATAGAGAAATIGAGAAATTGAGAAATTGAGAAATTGASLRPVPAADPAAWKAGVQRYQAELLAQRATAEIFPLYGTAITMETVNKLGGLPIGNFTRGSDPQTAAVGGTAMHEAIKARGGAGLTTHACMAGCTIRCSNVWPDPAGVEVVSSMEFETNALLGPNLEIYDLDAIARFTRECNDLGIDTMETGATLGVAMAAGLIPWGSVDGVLQMLDEVRAGSVTGRLIGAGGVLLGRVLGVRDVAAVKGQMMPAYDPRAIKGNGVTYATSPMGADHTAGNTIVVRVDQKSPVGKVALSREQQILCAMEDSLGICAFARSAWVADPETYLAPCNARTGAELSSADLLAAAAAVVRGEVAFNRRAGLGPETDRLPAFMREQGLPPHGTVFDVPEAELDALWAGD